MQRIFAFLFVLLLTLPTLAEPADTFAIAIRTRIDSLMKDKLFDRSHVGIYVYDLTTDEPLYEYGKQQRLRPASNMKLMTSITALSALGSDYDYQTRVYIADLVPNPVAIVDSTLADTVPPVPATFTASIVVKGGMDPLLGPDDLRAFAESLKERNITAIKGNIICDATFKDTVSMGWGWCWDDDYVPLTPFLYQGQAGKFDSAFRSALRTAGIAFNGKFIHGRVPVGAKLACTRTHSINEILDPMMKKSNNLYAETLFYQLAARSGKVNTTRKDAAEQVYALIKYIGHDPSEYTVADGSGLSLYNYLSAELLIDMLRYAYANEDIYSHLDPVLPIMGRDGTLRSRCIGTSAQDRVHAKTGTVTGVSSLSGYAQAANGHLLAFSIINQGISQSSQGRGFQDRVCQALTRSLVANAIEPDFLPNASDDEDDHDAEMEGEALPAEEQPDDMLTLPVPAE